jgi:hypothetical protein
MSVQQKNAVTAADKILRKYGVLIDPSTLSPLALQRVARLKNFPRIQTWQNLSTWSRAVFGEGEKVNIFLPRYVHQGTQLGTVQGLSVDVRNVSDLRESDIRSEYEDGEAVGFDSEVDDDIESEDDFESEEQQIVSSAGESQLEALREDRLGIRVLENIQDVQPDLENGLLLAVGRVLKKHQVDATFDVFEMAEALMNELNPLLISARRALERQ